MKMKNLILCAGLLASMVFWGVDARTFKVINNAGDKISLVGGVQTDFKRKGSKLQRWLSWPDKTVSPEYAPYREFDLGGTLPQNSVVVTLSDKAILAVKDSSFTSATFHFDELDSVTYNVYWAGKEICYVSNTGMACEVDPKTGKDINCVRESQLQCWRPSASFNPKNNMQYTISYDGKGYGLMVSEALCTVGGCL